MSCPWVRGWQRASPLPIRGPALQPAQVLVLVGEQVRIDRGTRTSSVPLTASSRPDVDRAVLAPMYLREIVYRLLQSEERHRLIDASRANATRNPVSAAIDYMKNHIDEPISVPVLADAVCMSESAFAHLFKQGVGVSPYQFLKQLRLERARDLLLDTHISVSEAAGQVGYTSLSHFISEFTLTCAARLWEFDVRTGKGINPGNSQLVVIETRVTDNNIEVLLPEGE